MDDNGAIQFTQCFGEILNIHTWMCVGNPHNDWQHGLPHQHHMWGRLWAILSFIVWISYIHPMYVGKILLRIIKQFLLICFCILYLYSLCNVDVEYLQQSISYLRELLSFFPADMTDQTKRAFGTGIFCGWQLAMHLVSFMF